MDSARAQRILRQHLLTDHLFGVNIVPTSGSSVTSASVALESQSSDAPPDSLSQHPREFFHLQAASPVVVPHDLTHAGESIWSKITIPNAAGNASLNTDEKQQLLDQINQLEVTSCQQCDLCQARTQTVFGEGSAKADLMFIGEGPGRDEDQQGRPIVGKPGDLLGKMIVAMGFKPEEVYIANVVKCRPPNNRTPTLSQVQACGGYLLRQIAIIQPKVIVTLGGPAANLLLDTTEGITKIRGNWHSFDALKPQGPSIDVMPTFHPNYLLRSYTKDNREKVWKDLQAVITRLQSK
ncbi:MAG: uracil-DNA glycosylase [Phycisphaeraceae bacterium]|nr:uracil-DNA glycosylase [Phycisphaeraceae bacterium]